MIIRFIFLLAISCFSLPLRAEQEQAAKFSEAFGHLIAKNIDALGVKFDLALVIKGLQDASQGKASPMSEASCLDAIAVAQETSSKIKAAENLKLAEDFLTSNSKNKETVSIEEGKLQYKIDKKGTGASVESHFHPVIRYIGKYINGTIFGQSQEDQIIVLDETIPGFRKGLIGMQEGEKRTLYIHPELGYGTQGILSPNSLLTFEVEIVKVNSLPDQTSDALIIESNTPKVSERNAQAIR